MPYALTHHHHGHPPVDIYPETTGMQAASGLKEAFRMAAVSPSSRLLQRDPATGHVFLYAVNPMEPASGIQSLPAGLHLSVIPRGLTVYAQLQDGRLVPIRRVTRRMDYLNPKALTKALKRTGGAARLCKKIIRSDAVNKKTFKAKKRRKR